MDALEFLRERKRMCIYYGHCEGCPLEEVSCALEQTDSDGDYGIVIATVEQWSKEHPIKTRQNVFLEQWPEAKVADDGILMLCPVVVSSTYRNQYGGCKTPCASCDDCCRKFWMQEAD